MTTRELIQKFNISANKSLGQNFLHRDDIIEQIADASVGKTDACIEVGAGLGVLTRELCQRFKTVTTVEIDKSLKDVTDFSLSGVKNHTMHYADFLKTDLLALANEQKITVVGNLPYYITADILKRLFKCANIIERAVVMVQKEAAEKLMAGAGQKNYRAISVMAQHLCNISLVCEVSPDCFIPAPHVFSSVVQLDFKNDINHTDTAEFFLFVNRVFSARRKKLTATLSAEQKPRAIKTLNNLGFLESARAEQLTPAQLYSVFCAIIG